MAFLLGVLLVATVGYSWVKSAMIPVGEQGSRYIPFDMYDATQVCNTEMEARMGSQLLRSYVDQHSTRLDSAEGVYRIYIKADIGTLQEYQEVSVYCFVDKWDHELSHYREVNPNKKNVTTGDLQFFKN